MKTILAHCKKDLISSRSLLAAWALCVALALAFLVIKQLFPHLSWLAPAPRANGVPTAIFTLVAVITGIVGAVGVQFVLLTLLVVRVIQLDLLTDPDAFWRTRPISGRSLLAAKSLFVAVLFLGALLSVAAVRFDQPSQLPSILTLAVFITGVAAFASTTTSLSQLILHWLAIGILAVFSAGTVLASGHAIIEALQGTLSLHGNRHLSLAADSDSVGISALYLAGFLAALLCQYFTLKTNLTRALLFATFFFAILWRNI